MLADMEKMYFHTLKSIAMMQWSWKLDVKLSFCAILVAMLFAVMLFIILWAVAWQPTFTTIIYIWAIPYNMVAKDFYDTWPVI